MKKISKFSLNRRERIEEMIAFISSSPSAHDGYMYLHNHIEGSKHIPFPVWLYAFKQAPELFEVIMLKQSITKTFVDKIAYNAFRRLRGQNSINMMRKYVNEHKIMPDILETVLRKCDRRMNDQLYLLGSDLASKDKPLFYHTIISIDLENMLRTLKDRELTETEISDYIDIGMFFYLIEHGVTVAEHLQKRALHKNGLDIAWIDNPSETLQLAAIKKTPTAFDLIRNPTDLVEYQYLTSVMK